MFWMRICHEQTVRILYRGRNSQYFVVNRRRSTRLRFHDEITSCDLFCGTHPRFDGRPTDDNFADITVISNNGRCVPEKRPFNLLISHNAVAYNTGEWAMLINDQFINKTDQ